MTTPPNYAAVRELTRGILDIGTAVVGTSREYLAEFAAVSAWSALAVLERPAGADLDDALGELEDQALAVAETISELSDHATRAALVRAIVAAVRVIAAFAIPV